MPSNEQQRMLFAQMVMDKIVSEQRDKESMKKLQEQIDNKTYSYNPTMMMTSGLAGSKSGSSSGMQFQREGSTRAPVGTSLRFKRTERPIPQAQIDQDASELQQLINNSAKQLKSIDAMKKDISKLTKTLTARPNEVTSQAEFEPASQQNLNKMQSDMDMLKGMLERQDAQFRTNPQPASPSPTVQPVQNRPRSPQMDGGASNIVQALAQEITQNTAETVRSIIPDRGSIIDALATNSPALKGLLAVGRGLSATHTRAKGRIREEQEVQPEPQVEPQPEKKEYSKETLDAIAQFLGRDPETFSMDDVPKMTIGKDLPEMTMEDIERQNQAFLRGDEDWRRPDYVEPQTQQLERIANVNEQQLEVIKKLHEVWDEPQIERIDDSLQNISDNQEELVRQNDEQMQAQQTEALDSLEGNGAASPSASPMTEAGQEIEKEEGSNLGIVGMFLGGISSLFGTIAAVAARVMPLIKKAFKFIRVGPIALITAIVDFGAGFFDAEEILGKAKVTMVDRIQAGISNVLGGFGRLVDLVAGWFGFDTGLGKMLQNGFIQLSQPVFDFFNNIVDRLTAGITGDTTVIDAVNQFGVNVKDTFVFYFKEITGMFQNGWQTISNFMGQSWENFKDGVANKWHEWVEMPITQMGMGIADLFGDLRNSVTERISNVVTGVKDTFTGWVDSIKDMFTFGSDEVDEQEIDVGVSDALSSIIADAPAMMERFLGNIWNGMIDNLLSNIPEFARDLIPDDVLSGLESLKMGDAEDTPAAMGVEADRSVDENRRQSTVRNRDNAQTMQQEQESAQRMNEIKAMTANNPGGETTAQTKGDSANVNMMNNVDNSRRINNTYVNSTIELDNPRRKSFNSQTLLAGN